MHIKLFKILIIKNLAKKELTRHRSDDIIERLRKRACPVGDGIGRSGRKRGLRRDRKGTGKVYSEGTGA